MVIRITKGGGITFDSAAPYLGKGNMEAARLLFETYGDKVGLGICARCSAGTRADRARIFALIGALASKRRPGLSVGYWAFGFCSRVSTGPPASRQAVKPPPMWQTGARPMSRTALAASAERQPMEQKNTNRLPD